MKTEIKVGEYTVIHENGTNFHALRHGEKWRDLTGDNLVLALVSRIEQLEKLWTEPSKEMVQAGLAEVQRILDEWESESTFGYNVEETTDSMASDMSVFVLQAMAGKLPKEP
ncbi:hypothetical protein WID10_28350 [Klebsiella variicola]|uniref:hypothetical protein n=1 Tax=Klebsiella variicola TaxID=244366 RepID=UPI00339CE454